MGLDTRAKGTYITILNGKFAQRVEKDTEGAVTRTNKLGKEVSEKFYDTLSGKLTGINVKDGDYGKSWVFHFDDEGEQFHLQLSYSNSYATNLLKMLPNLDLTKPFKLAPSQKIVDGKTQSSLFINQDNTPIKHAFTKDNPNGLPDLKKIKVKGKDTWDDSDRLEFLLEMVNTKILPQLNQSPISATPEPEKKDGAVATIEDIAADGEDVPF